MHHKLGGRLRHHLPFWRTITTDPFVLSLVAGATFDFNCEVPPNNPVPEIHMNKDEQAFVDKKLLKLIKQGSVRRLKKPIKGGYFNNIFLVSKRQGGHRMICNMKNLNSMIKYVHYKQEDIFDTLSMVKEGSVMCSLDIDSAYEHVHVRGEFQKYLMFTWRGVPHVFQTLPQGATCSPRYYVRITSAVVKYLRRRMVVVMFYIDDSILIADTPSELTRNRDLTTSTLEKCGFLINYEKSHLTPTTRLEFLGFLIDSVEYCISLTAEKRSSIHRMLANLLSNTEQRVSIRQLAKIIGKLVATFPATNEGQLHYRILERFKVKCLIQKQKQLEY